MAMVTCGGKYIIFLAQTEVKRKWGVLLHCLCHQQRTMNTIPNEGSFYRSWGLGSRKYLESQNHRTVILEGIRNILLQPFLFFKERHLPTVIHTPDNWQRQARIQAQYSHYTIIYPSLLATP